MVFYGFMVANPKTLRVANPKTLRVANLKTINFPCILQWFYGC
jgi:hypothetical protein